MLNTLFEAPRKRPTLVTIIAALLAVEGLVWLVLGILAFIAVITNGKQHWPRSSLPGHCGRSSAGPFGPHWSSTYSTFCRVFSF